MSLCPYLCKHLWTYKWKSICIHRTGQKQGNNLISHHTFCQRRNLRAAFSRKKKKTPLPDCSLALTADRRARWKTSSSTTPMTPTPLSCQQHPPPSSKIHRGSDVVGKKHTRIQKKCTPIWFGLNQMQDLFHVTGSVCRYQRILTH